MWENKPQFVFVLFHRHSTEEDENCKLGFRNERSKLICTNRSLNIQLNTDAVGSVDLSHISLVNFIFSCRLNAADTRLRSISDT